MTDVNPLVLDPPTLGTSRLMQRELSLYRASCGCTRRVQDRARLLHERLDRVIVFDLRFRWWGLGNNLVRWLSLLRVGLASGRATFLWFSGGRHGAGGGSTAFFDIGEYLVSEGADWHWAPPTQQRVLARMEQLNESGPTRIYHKCLKSGLMCERHELRWEVGRGRQRRTLTQVGTEGEERNGSLLKLLTTHPSRWLLLVPEVRGGMTALQPSGKPASAVLSGQAGGGWGGGWDARAGSAGWEGSCWNASSGVRGSMRDATTRGNALHLPAHVALAMGATEPSRGRPIRSRISFKCEAFAFLRPRPKLQRLIAPVVVQLDALRAATGFVTGLHVRTGYPDWVALSALPNGSARPAWKQAVALAAAQPLAYAEHWRRIESFLEECAELPVKPGSRPCFSWHYPHSGRAPAVDDAMRLCGPGQAAQSCVRSQGCHKPATAGDGSSTSSLGTGGSSSSPTPEDALRMPGNGTLAAAVICAVRLRGGAAGEEAASGPRSGLLVLGDAPGVVSLLRQHPALRVVHTSSTGSLGHTQFDLACSASAGAPGGHGGGGAPGGGGDRAGECNKGSADPEGGWSRTMVDFYVGGLADAFVTTLDTTFPDGAVLLRSLSCCSASRRMHFSASSNAATNRDRPMENVGFLRVLMHEAAPYST